MYSRKTIETANAILLQRRQKARQEAAQRQAELYSRHPRLREYDRQLRGLTRSIALAAISGAAEAAGQPGAPPGHPGAPISMPPL